MTTNKHPQRQLHLTPTIRHMLENLHISMSAAITQSIVNAFEDDTLVVKALKRRMAMPPSPETPSVRMCFSVDPKVGKYIEYMAGKSQLSAEAVVRLAVEAYMHKL